MEESKSKARISSITIENFKGIGAPVTIPLREFTLLFGKNSVGKSTIIEALLLMNDWMQNLGPDLDTLTLGGAAVHLGGFERFVHGHDLSREVRIRIDMDLADTVLPKYPSAIIDSYLHDGWSEEENRENDERDLDSVDVHNLIDVRSCYFEIVAGRNPDTEQICFLECSAGVNGEHIVSRKGVGYENANQLIINDMHPAVTALKKTDSMTRKFLNFHAEKPQFTIYIPALTEREAKEAGYQSGYRDFRSALPIYWDLPASLHDSEIEENNAIWKRHRIRPIKKVGEYNYRFINHFLSQTFLGSGRRIHDQLKEQIFIGPLRQVPTRIVSSPKETNWADGSKAWDSLLSPEFVLDKKEYDRSVKEAKRTFRSVDHLDEETKSRFLEGEIEGLKSFQNWKWLVAPTYKKENYEASVNRFNKATELIGLRYGLRLKAICELSDDCSLIQAAQAIKEHPRSKEALDMLLSALSEDLATEYEAVFVERQTGIELRPSELGIGVSQMMPLLIAAQHSFSILSIQQPELHLHPAMQCDLADYLQFYLKRFGADRICMIETHSEHMILRLLRRIRETSQGKHADNEIRQLFKNQVSILYVDEGENGAEVFEMEISESGELLTPWPNGFFPERMQEILGE